jgi:hypothetical protein
VTGSYTKGFENKLSEAFTAFSLKISWFKYQQPQRGLN